MVRQAGFIQIDVIVLDEGILLEGQYDVRKAGIKQKVWSYLLYQNTVVALGPWIVPAIELCLIHMTRKIPVGRQPEGELDEPFPKAVIRGVYECMSDLGYDVPSHEEYAVLEEADGLRDGAGILPAFMVGSNNDIPDLIRTGVLFPFDLEETLEDKAERGDSGAHVASQFVDGDLGLREAIIEPPLEWAR